MTIEDLENTAKSISEKIFASAILAMNYVNSVHAAETEGSLSVTSSTWRMFCNDVDTFFKLNAEENRLFGNRFLQLTRNADQMGCVTKEIIDDILVLLHEMRNNALLKVRGAELKEELLVNLASRAETIAENIASEQTLSMITGDEPNKHVADLSTSNSDWKMLCNDFDTFFKLNVANTGNTTFDDCKTKFEKIRSIANKRHTVTIKIIETVKVLIHEMQNKVLLQNNLVSSTEIEKILDSNNE